MSTVYVANAYPGDILVRVDTDRVKDSKSMSKQDIKGSGKITIPGNLEISGVGAHLRKKEENKSSHDYHVRKESGFVRLPSGKVTPYCPPQDHKDKDRRRTYVTIKTIDANGDLDMIADNFPCEESTCLIITKEGFITRAGTNLGKPDAKWIDVDGEEHLKPSCSKCLDQGRPCRICLFDAKTKVFKSCIETMNECKISEVLTDTIAEMEHNKLVAKDREADDMIGKIKVLASTYFILEGRTKQCVMTIQSYGKGLLESVEDFFEDHDWKSVFWEMENFESVTNKLKDVIDTHKMIKDQASSVKKSVKKQHKFVEEKLQLAEDGKLGDDKAFAAIVATPGVRQVVGGVGGAIAGAGKAVDLIDGLEWHPVASLPLKCVGGGLGALGGGAAGVVAGMPVALYLGFKEIVSRVGSEKYKKLAKKFIEIGNQMEMVGAHLEEIESSLTKIDGQFEKSKSAEEKLSAKIKQTITAEDLETQISRVETTARELVDVCDDYLGLIKKDVVAKQIT